MWKIPQKMFHGDGYWNIVKDRKIDENKYNDKYECTRHSGSRGGDTQ